MKMKRSEKLGMFTGLVVGVLLLLISVFMIFQTTCKVWGAEKPANATQQGIDVSSHQGKIDWEQVKNSALADYAIIRCGYGVNQTDKDDKYWDYNSSECERLGIPYGTYLYSGADTTAKAKSEAEHVVRLLQGKNLTYPIYYDMEADMLNQLSSTQIGNIAKTFLNTMESYGYKNVAVYSNKYLFETKLTASVFPKTATDKLTWSTSNKKVVTVTKSGKIKGVKTGTATITVKTTSGKKATCKITVK